MKKLLSLLLILFMSFSLASCGDEGSQRVTIKNDKGEDVEVVLNATDNEEVVKHAMSYVTQANYEDVKALNLNLSAEGKAIFNDKESLSGKLTANIGADTEKKALYATAGLDFSGTMDTSDTEEEKLETHTVKGDAHLAYAMGDSLLPDMNIYAGVNAKVDADSIDKKVKLDLAELSQLIGGLLPDNMPSSPVRTAALPELPEIQLPTAEDITKALEKLKTLLPKSKLEISYVSGEKFTMTFNLSMKDALKKFDEINGTKFEAELNNDFTVALNADFELKTGRFGGINLEVNNSFLLKLAGIADVTADTKLNLKLALAMSYGETPVKVLTAEEKALYEALDLNAPID